jgi:hypothetical protein
MDSERRHHFEREVPTYAEPVSADDLKEGEIYFSLQFDDESLLLPIVETLVFTGRGKGDDGSAILCFQDLDSYRLGIERGSPEADCAAFYALHEQNLNHIFEYDRALDRLIECSLRRQRAKR